MPRIDPPARDLAAFATPTPDTEPPLDPRLAGLLRQALNGAAAPRHGPRARLLRGGASAIGGDRPQFRAPGGATAMQLAAALTEMRGIAAAAEARQPYSMERLHQLQNNAVDLAVHAGDEAEAAELAAEVTPRASPLRQAALQARHNANHARRSSVQISATATRTWRLVGESALHGLRNLADWAVQSSNHATEAAVDLWLGLGGDRAIAKALIETGAENANALIDRGAASDGEAFAKATSQLANGDPRVFRALQAARNMRAEAAEMALAAEDAEGAVGMLQNRERRAATLVRAAQAAFDSSDAAASAQAFAEATSAATQSQHSLWAVFQSHQEMAQIGRRITEYQQMGFPLEPAPAPARPPAPEAGAGGTDADAPEYPSDMSALRVQEHPAGVPGEMQLGGTLVTIEPADAAALADAGAEAGTAARAAIEDAAATHGAADPAAAHAAAKAGTLEHSNALAKQIFDNPKVMDTLRGAGRVVTVAAVATMAVQLGKAIHADALAGDKAAPVTRKVLAELLGGVLGAEAGALAGAAAGGLLGGALGSVLPVVGNAVGAFVGGIAGGLAGGISGWIGGSRQGRSLEHLVDELIASKGKSDTPWVKAGSAAAAHDGAAIVKASSSKDDHVNASELRQGWKALDLKVDIGERQLAALINAYGSRGVGALSPADLDRALADGALRIDGQNQVTVEPLEFTLNLDTPGQEGRAANIAKRLVNLGSSDEGADRLLNTDELMDALEDAGCNRSIDKGRFSRLVAAYDRSGDGALSEVEIAQAIHDGALEFDTEGGVFVHEQTITGQSRHSAANIGLRMVKAGPGNELLATANDLKDGMKQAGFEPRLDDADWQALVAAHGDAATGLIGPEGIARALAEGQLVIDADGGVRSKAV